MRQAQEHVERILDEESDQRIGVVVQMGTPNLTEAGVAAAIEEIADQYFATSTREVLPEVVRVARAAALGVGAHGGGVPAVRPRASRAVTAPPAPSVDRLRRENEAALEPLVASEPGRRCRAEGPGKLAALWAARSVYLELDRDDLARLPVEVPGIRAVDRNWTFHVPPVATARELPDSVLENSTASWGLLTSGALAVWGAYGARGSGTLIGVLDTGVDATHPDLQGKIKHWAEFTANGEVVAGSQPHDTDRHGTHVCGTIAGGNSSGQWIGMAPDADLAVGMVLSGGTGTSSQVLAGIGWAIQQGVDVLSMSLSSPVFGHVSPASYTEAFLTCLRAGIPVVAAIGNRGEQTGASTGSDVFAYAVGATDHRDLPAGFSGGHTQAWDPPGDRPPVYYTKPDVSAPGVGIVSAIPGASWAAFNGTSMATPHVAGAMALLLSAVPEIRDELSGIQRTLFLQKMISGSADDLGEAGHDARYGLGRLNVLRAIALARQPSA